MKREHVCGRLAGALGVAVFLAGCAGVQTSRFSHDESYKQNQAIKGEGCYDAAVLLGAGPAQAREIAKKVLVGIDSTIHEETPSQLKAQRNRHIGVFVGSGGEELSVTLKGVGEDKTFVTATTKTGFVGGAGQRAWSCQVIDEMIKMASR